MTTNEQINTDETAYLAEKVFDNIVKTLTPPTSNPSEIRRLSNNDWAHKVWPYAK